MQKEGTAFKVVATRSRVLSDITNKHRMERLQDKNLEVGHINPQQA
jgi:hypothetical protein